MPDINEVIQVEPHVNNEPIPVTFENIANAIRSKTGDSNVIYPDEMADLISTLGGGDIDPYSEFVQMNPLAAEFLADDTYENSDSGSVMSSIYRPEAIRIAENTQYDPPSPIDTSIYPNLTIPYRTDEPVAKQVNITASGKLSVVDSKKYVQTSANDITAGNNNIYNLTPNELAYYLNQNNNQVLQCGSLKGSGQVRMIHTTTQKNNTRSCNVRDLGGWECDGSTLEHTARIKYGKIFRGGRFNGGGLNISDLDVTTFHDLLGIRDEIDLRKDSEVTDVTGSAFGDDVMWHHFALPSDSSSYIRDINSPLYGEVFKQIAHDLEYDTPLYIHCLAGCDRTGIICMMLEGLCGVARYNIDKDYELSSLVNFTMAYNGVVEWDSNITYAKSTSTSRVRVSYEDRIWESTEDNNTTVPGTIGAYWNDVTVTSEYVRYRTGGTWIGLLNAINDNYVGNTFRDKIVSYMLGVGVTIDEINTIRQNLIDGSPEVVVVPTCDIEYNLSAPVTSTNTDTSVELYQPYTTTLEIPQGYTMQSIVVTMGGDNITSQVVSNNDIDIPSVTGAVRISASATINTYSISNTLVHCSNSNPAQNIEHGSSYLATITPDTGYQITANDIEVIMNNTLIPVTIENSVAIINITSATGNISIDAEAVDVSQTFSISISLVHASSSNTSQTVSENTSYHTTITPDTDYIFESASDITVTMAGAGTITTTYDSVAGTIDVDSPSVTGNISIQGSATANFYTVTYNLVNVDGSESVTKVIKNSYYSIDLTPITGCNFTQSSQPSCTMGGSSVSIIDLTGDNLGKKRIDIVSVTGDIVINATAPHVDIVSSAYFSHGTQYDAVGYTLNKRINTSGAWTTDANYACVGLCNQGNNGYIRVEADDVFSAANVEITTAGNKQKFAYYEENQSIIQCVDKTATPPQLIAGQSKDFWNSTYTSVRGHSTGFYLWNYSLGVYLVKCEMGVNSTSNYYYNTAGGAYPDDPSLIMVPAKYVRMNFTAVEDGNSGYEAPVVYLYESSDPNCPEVN